MRTILSMLVPTVGVILAAGCANGSADDPAAEPAAPSAGGQHPAPAAAAGETDTGPTVLGVDADLRQEMRLLIAEHLEQQNVPGDRTENISRALDTAMARLRRSANDFGVEADASGNIEWPANINEELLSPLRAKFDAKQLFSTYDVKLPPWAAPLIEQHQADTIIPARRELLFRLASAEIIRELT